jgi:hypothetical protein
MLKTSEQRQLPQSDKNLKSVTWSKDSMTLNSAIERPPSGVQKHSHIIKTMLTKISENTKRDIEGDIFCYEVMNPQDAEMGYG